MVRQTRHGAVLLVELDRPDTHNSLTVAVADALVGTWEDAARSGVGALVLAGTGPSFCSGADLVDVAGDLGGNTPGERLEVMRRLQRVVMTMRESPAPTVAAVHGSVYGAGWSLVLAADLVVASQDARFCQAFVGRGLVPDLGSAWLLTRGVGSLRAKELMLLGEAVPAEQAYAWGLVNRLTESRDDAVEAAIGLAQRLAQTDSAATYLTRQLVHASAAQSFEESLRLEQSAQGVAWGSPAAHAAITAFRSPG